MYRTGQTIHETLKNIENHTYVLPAIQREYVWQPEQICRLYDSFMQGYPFGAFLFWNVEPENSRQWKFYDFVREYHQRNNPHCPELGILPNTRLIAVLDGQQRLTAINIGLRGSMAVKEPNKWWSNPDAFPIRHLYLNLLAERGDEEQGNAYDFDFLTEARAPQADESHFYFKVADILRMNTGPDMTEWLMEKGLEGEGFKRAYRTLDRLHRVVYVEQCIAFYEETEQDLERVLNIFIRMNSGGTPLSYSDLLLSIAVAQWETKDARREIHTLVDEINDIGNGFALSHDFVLKAGLMLTDIASVGFRVANFNRENMALLETQWDEVRRALILTVSLVASFGFNGQTLRADSALLPIAYYLYRKGSPHNFITHSQFETDRTAIRNWLLRSLLKASGIWGSGLDTLLTALRAVIREAGTNDFPVEELREAMARRGKSLVFEPEEIEELADMAYGDRRLFPLLSFLFPFVDLRNHFHIDHVFPASRITAKKLRDVGIPDEEHEVFQARRDKLANLQLLGSELNNEKRAKLPSEWLVATYPDEATRQDHCERHLLGDVPPDIAGFPKFVEARRARLHARIAEMINP